MEFHFRMYGVSRRMCYVRVTYVWRMKCARDVSTAYVLCNNVVGDVFCLFVDLESRRQEYESLVC